MRLGSINSSRNFEPHSSDSYTIHTNRKTCGKVNKDSLFLWTIHLWNTSQKKELMSSQFEWMNGFLRSAVGAQHDTGCSYSPMLLWGLCAKRGNEETMPSVLYVACLWGLHYRSWLPAQCGRELWRCNSEMWNMKHTKSNTVITLAVL